MPIAIGVNKRLAFKKETAGTPNTAPGATGAQVVRRVESSFSLRKQAYQSEEIRTDYQLADFRHGARSVEGSIRGELAPNSYADFFAAACGAAWATGATTGALTTIAATVSGNILTLTRAAGSFLTDGHKVGDIVRQSGWTTTGTANNAKNGRILTLTPTVMTIADLQGAPAPFAAKASGDSVTVSVTGRKLLIPQTGHTDDSFWIEEWHPDTLLSEQFGGCSVQRLGLNLQANGITQIDIGFLGYDMVTAGAAYYTTPTAAGTAGVLAAPNGRLRVGGVDVATVTSLQMTLETGLTNAQVVGSNITPDLFPGRKIVTGSFSAYFEDGALRDAFINESNIALQSYLTGSTAANSPCFAFKIDNLKLGQADKTDGQQGIIRNYTFQAILNAAGGAGTATDLTTIAFQDTEIP
jgi:hypothetical protein